MRKNIADSRQFLSFDQIESVCMRDWIDEEYCIDEEEFVDEDNDLSGSDDVKPLDARRRLEMLLEEKQLLDDIDDFH